MKVFSIALLSAIASARQSTNLLDLSSFPGLNKKLNDHFGSFGNLNRDHDIIFDDIDDLNLDNGPGLQDWNPFEETHVEKFDTTRVTKTSSSTRKYSDGTRVITLVKTMEDKETTNVITIMRDGAWRQKTSTKYDQNQQDESSDDDNVVVPPKPEIIVPPKPEITKPSSCIKKHSVEKCGKCNSHDQCGQGSFCCPYMKKCVTSSSTSCFFPIAGCRGSNCANKDFPNNWAGKTCTGNKENSSKKDTTITKPLSGKRMMGVKERDAFNEQNKIRTNPKTVVGTVKAELKLFDSRGKTIRRPGMNLRTNEGIGAWHEAIDELENQETFAPLKWNDYLALAAQDHCNDQGPLGLTGHNGQDGSSPWDRINRYGRWGGTVSENLAYSESEGADYMVQLYIDDGVADRGHRVNMLNPKLELTGMAYCDHAKYGGMMAVTYAKSFKPNSHGKSAVISRAKN